jgi:phosphatidylglycerol:prolipoprotein diacylglycerol transferase
MLPHLPLLPWPTTYGLLVALGFLLGWLWIGRLAPRVGLDPALARETVVLAALCGLVGAKLLLLVLEPWLVTAPWELLTQAGVFYGGLVAAVAFAIAWSRRLGFDVQAFGDAAAPALALGHAFGRLGCFAAGCCWGRPCELPWGARFTDPEAIVLAIQPWVAGRPLHPTQLYEAAAELALAGLAALLLGRRRFVGQVWWSYVALYAVIRSVIEHFRGDPRGTWHGVSTSQGVAGLLLLVAAVMLVVQARRAPLARPGREPSPEAGRAAVPVGEAGAPGEPPP